MNPKISRRKSLKLADASTALACGTRFACGTPVALGATEGTYPTHEDTFGLLDQGKKIPVVFDTDIGGDMAYSEDLLNMEMLEIAVEDDGMTRIEPGSPKVRCATSWKDQAAFEDMLVRRLTRQA